MRIRTLLFICVAFTLGVFASGRINQRADIATDAHAAERFEISGGVATLYALDPLARAFCFGDGGDGQSFHDNQVRNRCSDIDFSNYTSGSFSVGIEGGRLGSIVDLGSALELKKRYGYEETVGNGQGFASLRLLNGRIMILKHYRNQTIQELNESEKLFAPGQSSASAAVKLGNIYLMRLTDRRDKNFERIVKFQVIAHVPGETVTIRWQTL